MVHCSVPTVGTKFIISLWPHPHHTSLQHQSASKYQQTYLCNPTENAVLPSLYRKAADAQKDVAFWKGQYHIFRVHILLFQFKHLEFNPSHQTACGHTQNASWKKLRAQNFCSALQDGKGCLSLGPYSAAKGSFPLLSMPGPFVMALLTSVLSEKEVENEDSESVGCKCVEGTQKPSSPLASHDVERSSSALLYAPGPAIPPSFQVILWQHFAACRTVCISFMKPNLHFLAMAQKFCPTHCRQKEHIHPPLEKPASSHSHSFSPEPHSAFMVLLGMQRVIK